MSLESALKDVLANLMAILRQDIASASVHKDGMLIMKQTCVSWIALNHISLIQQPKHVSWYAQNLNYYLDSLLIEHASRVVRKLHMPISNLKHVQWNVHI